MNSEPVRTGDAGSKKAPSASVMDVIRTVVFAFFGVRKRTQHEMETVHLKPVQIIVAGLLGAVLFVSSLVLLVKYIVGRAAG